MFESAFFRTPCLQVESAQRAIASVADVVMRKETCDVPSLLCLNYGGHAAGPGAPFGFEVGSFAVESEDLQLSAPELHVARSRVLDYFAAQVKPRETTRVNHPVTTRM